MYKKRNRHCCSSTERYCSAHFKQSQGSSCNNKDRFRLPWPAALSFWYISEGVKSEVESVVEIAELSFAIRLQEVRVKINL